MVNLEALLEEDAEGIIIISKLFDYAVREIYGDIETDPFVVCELDDKQGVLEFSSNTGEGKTLKLTIEGNGNVSFWCDNIPCHFNQFEIYKHIFKIKYVS